MVPAHAYNEYRLVFETTEILPQTSLFFECVVEPLEMCAFYITVRDNNVITCIYMVCIVVA